MEYVKVGGEVAMPKILLMAWRTIAEATCDPEDLDAH